MGVVKEDTHKPLFQDSSSSSTSSSPLYILTVAPLVIPPLRSLSGSAAVAVFTLLERERRGTIPPFRETVDPTAERGSLHGGQPTPVPQTSQPHATEFNTHITLTVTQTAPRSALLHCIILSLCWPFCLSHISHKPPLSDRGRLEDVD